ALAAGPAPDRDAPRCRREPGHRRRRHESRRVHRRSGGRPRGGGVRDGRAEAWLGGGRRGWESGRDLHHGGRPASARSGAGRPRVSPGPPPHPHTGFAMDHDTFTLAKRYVDFDASMQAALKSFHPIAQPHFGPIVDDFYDVIERFPTARAVITGGREQIKRLKLTLIEWLESLLAGPHDAAYLEARARIGRVHVRIGL